jgi:metal-sulfur cluster biosynthetic enzyme
MTESNLAGHKPAPEYPENSPEAIVKEALRTVKDPEIGLDVIQLGLIREIELGLAEPEIKMMLTTPFCPYGGWLIQSVRDAAEHVAGKKIKVTVIPDLWDPNFMEDPGLLMGW